MVTLRERREALGFTQQEVADSAGTTQGNYGRIELGTTQIPRIELRRELSRVLGMTHVEFLVAIGELGDWEVPGFDASAEPPDTELEARLALLREIDLTRDNRGPTLDSILRLWSRQDRGEADAPPSRSGSESDR